jgi:hypothetical protein
MEAGSMSARDKYHDAVRNALIKDGWTITHDPYKLVVGVDRVYVDLGAERVIAAERGTEKIAVEIKTFGSPSDMHDLELAIGQYLLYRSSLRRREPERTLFLAVPQGVVDSTFEGQMARYALEDFQICHIGFDPEQEVITQWKMR